MKSFARILVAALVVAAVTPAVAQDKAMGSHSMSGTVTNVDNKTGMIQVDAGGHALTLHFPPPALADVKNGDKITLHMSFSKDSGM